MKFTATRFASATSAALAFAASLFVSTSADGQCPGTCSGGTGCLQSQTFTGHYQGTNLPPPNPPALPNPGGVPNCTIPTLQTIPITQFNPSLGTLISVSYSMTLRVTTSVVTVQAGDPSCSYTIGVRYDYQFWDPTCTQAFTANVFDSVQNIMTGTIPPTGYNSGELFGPTGTTHSASFCRTSNFTPFVGTGTANFFPTIISTNSFIGSGCANSAATLNTLSNADVTVTYNYCTAGPQANPDTAETCAGTATLAGTPVLINVLANDPGAVAGQVDCASVVRTSTPSFGTAVLASCGAGSLPCTGNACFLYTPNAGVATGSTPVQDTFRYTYRSLTNCTSNEATVTVTIHPRPVGVVDNISACQGVTINFDPIANDTFAGPLIVGGTTVVRAAGPNCASISVPSQPPASQGVVSINQTCTGAGTHPCPGRCLTFVPNASFTGTSTFNYLFTDTNGCQGQGTVNLTFTRRPVGTGANLTICQDSTADFDVTAHTTLSQGTINCSSVTITTQPAHGSVCSAATCPSCHIIYTPNPGFVGTDSFAYTVANSNGCATNAATVNITVKGRPIAVDDVAQLTSLAPITIHLYNNDNVVHPLTGTVVGSLLPACPAMHGTVTSFNAVTGDLVYTPAANFSGEEILCYQLCETSTLGNCCSQANVHITLLNPCMEINRQTPGSLLIFPQFDNRTQRVTLVTITNTLCDFALEPNGQFTHRIDVHIVYVGKYGPGHVPLPCTEFDHTIHLTPCDTFTFYTSFDNPGMEEGYIYAYAVDPVSGVPVSYNHLIGQEIVFGSFEDNEDAVNAIVFHAIPQTDGAPTELNGNGLRDLDGVEYDQAPDQILIPRFLGQDPPGPGAIFRSQLFLIALSGGTLFDTQLSFLIYNDNEVQSSATYTFRCWDDPFLTPDPILGGISNAFLNSTLKNEGDDPNEILGATARESGWMKINGVIAYSTNHVIPDPAFYAVLLERTNPRAVIDLPWELCTQANGKLLPHSIDGQF